MKQGIEKIIDFVTITVLPKQALTLDLSETRLKALLEAVSVDIELTKKYLITSLFDLEKQDKVEALVQNYQSLIIELLDILFTYQASTQKFDLINLYSSISILLSDVLSYLETYFSKYLNIYAKIPEMYGTQDDEEFKVGVSTFRTRFEGKSEDLQLIEILASHYKVGKNELNKRNFAYRDREYRKELFGELTKLASNNSVYKSVKDVLLYLNFNHILFFKYLVDNLQEEYNRLETLEVKIDLLKYRRKQIRQMLSHGNVALFPDLPSIKDQVVNWIEEEIYFIEGGVKPVVPEPEKNELSAESKIGVALSVAQLGVLIRVLVLGKIITNTNQLQVIKTIASNFRTYKTEDISYSSLYGKYYKPEASAIRGVRGILLQLVTVITKLRE